MVGVALQSFPNFARSISKPNLQPLGPPAVVTKCVCYIYLASFANEVSRASGNLIHQIDNRKPAAVIHQALQSQRISHAEWKDLCIVAGITGSSRGPGPEKYVPQDSSKLQSHDTRQFTQYYEVSAGAPSRGTIALNGTVGNLEDYVCQVGFGSPYFETGAFNLYTKL